MIRKAVIPAAGFGSRFLPATKAQPKEMLPIIDTPTIQYVVEEAVASGITEVLIITGKGKQAIENHFDRSFELESELERTQRQAQLEEVRRLSEMAAIFYTRQKELNGLGDAIRYARSFVGDEPFVVLLGDTIVRSNPPCTRQLIDAYTHYKNAIIALEEVPADKVDRYGIIAGSLVNEGIFRVSDLIEKPPLDSAPSTLAIAGRYVLEPSIFDFLDRTAPGKAGEIQLTDALRALSKKHELLGLRFEGKRYDVGNKLDYLTTMVEFGVQREDFGYEFREFLKQFVGTLQ